MLKKEFEIAYVNYKNIVYTYLYQLCCNHFLAEDISQDVFLKVYSNINKFRGESSLKTWILRIARNTYIDYMRKNKESISPIDELEMADTEQDPEREAINSERGRIITEVLKRLPEDYRTIIILREQQELTYDEIGRVMDFSPSNVKITLFRARKKFKELYLKLGGIDDVM